MRGVEIPCHSTNQARGLKVKGKNMPAGLSVDSGAKAGWRSKAAWRGRGGEGQRSGEDSSHPGWETEREAVAALPELVLLARSPNLFGFSSP